MNGKRRMYRDARVLSDAAIARRGMARIVERERNAQIRECARRWIANTPKTEGESC